MTEAIAPASPSASVLLISATNEILLLRRVQTSTSFASAHVFPGGHLSPQDGDIFPPADVRRHEDSEAYRMAAIRECFEESGILLARNRERPEELLSLSDEERENGRHEIHQEKMDFRTWVQQRNGVPDIENLIPFTRWLTPSKRAKRFTTQMYLYFLPIPSPSSSPPTSPSSFALPPTTHIPTPDGGIEHTTANFASPVTWLAQYAREQIILFFPQFYLLSLISPFLSPSSHSHSHSHPPDTPTLHRHRTSLLDFTRTSDPPWGQKCLSSTPVFETEDRLVATLDGPGPELEGTERRGDADRVMVVFKRMGQGKGEAPRFGLAGRSEFEAERERERL